MRDASPQNPRDNIASHSADRIALKEASANSKRLADEIEKLASAIKRATATSEDASQELLQHGALDQEITRWRVAQVKKGLSTKTLPTALKDKIEARRNAEDEIEQSKSTLEVLNQELRELRKQHRACETERENSALQVLLHEEGANLAGEYTSAMTRAAELRLLLEGLAHIRLLASVGTDRVRPRYSQAMNEAIQSEGVRFPENTYPFEDMGTRWKTRLERLKKNPDATVDRPKIIAPSDYVRVNAGSIHGIVLPGTYAVKPEN